jgi:hypothetical protein
LDRRGAGGIGVEPKRFLTACVSGDGAAFMKDFADSWICSSQMLENR